MNNKSNHRSHPTTQFQKSNRLPDIFTSNGFCFCDSSPDACTVAQDDLCGLKDTASSLFDETFRIAKSLRNNSCLEQLDWPFVSGVLRDGSQTNTSSPNAPCDVNPRLPPFVYRYMPSGKVSKPKTTSLSKGGVCHMGIAPELPTDFTYTTGICRKINETVDNINVLCHTTSDAPDIEYTLPKGMSAAPPWAAQNMKSTRQSCAACSAPPKWMDQSGDTPLPGGAEVSYGTPFRWSASRMLASDMRSIICGSHHNTSTACNKMLNTSAWGIGNFIEYFTADAKKLFHQRPRFNSSNSSNSPDKPEIHRQSLAEAINSRKKYDDSELWNGPNAGWVACSQQPDGKCHGGINKEDWYSPRRGAECVNVFTKMVEDGKVNETTVPLDICNLDSQMNLMCQKLLQARDKVKKGNCLSAGKCLSDVYVYNPGMYSVSNQNFVRSTVISFYETYGIQSGQTTIRSLTRNNSDLVCPMDDDELALRQSNNDRTTMCASRQLERVQMALRIARMVVHILVEVYYICIQLCVTLFRLVMPGLYYKIY
jgi:hypothetical protein